MGDVSAPERRAMGRAIHLAGRGGTHPNPCVGAVLLDPAGAVIAEGVTDPRPGTAHAEQVALSALADRPAQSMVVTLEPCDHTGCTPPCTDAIIAAGLSRVVIGAIDPDARVAGRGVERLRRAGIEVEVGCLADQVEATDPGYFHHRRTGRARMVAKAAMTLDGQTAAADGSSQWITSEHARRDAHELRARFDAVAVGAGTLRSDDPSLTVRLDHHTGPQPVAVVVAGQRRLPPAARLWKRPGTIVVATAAVDLAVESVVVEAGADGLVDPVSLARVLGERGIIDVLVEGGAGLTASLWSHGVIEAGVFYLGAKVAGGTGRGFSSAPWSTLVDSDAVTIDAVRRVGPDLRVDWSRRPVQE